MSECNCQPYTLKNEHQAITANKTGIPTNCVAVQIANTGNTVLYLKLNGGGPERPIKVGGCPVTFNAFDRFGKIVDTIDIRFAGGAGEAYITRQTALVCQ